jgi:hypothetical protein
LRTQTTTRPTLASLDAEVRARRASTCGIAATFAKLEPDDRTILEGWLADDTVEHAKISAALTQIGFRVAGNTIGRHRRGICSCP